uniref:WRKY19-like zinc finger domain-containing protein n=1 Tax=Globisporangium ultimum (strain ATCC 200006 / CBS 805.95 / DAOM BR144) TaxID=431595 RepID=K3XBT7_GLOUD
MERHGTIASNIVPAQTAQRWAHGLQQLQAYAVASTLNPLQRSDLEPSATPRTSVHERPHGVDSSPHQYAHMMEISSHDAMHSDEDATNAPTSSKASLDFIMNDGLSSTTKAAVACSAANEARDLPNKEVRSTRAVRQSARLPSTSRSLNANAAPANRTRSTTSTAPSQPSVDSDATESDPSLLSSPSSSSNKRSRHAVTERKKSTKVATSGSKPKAIEKSKATDALSYEEKRRARECKVDGCPNYIINKGLCFRHGGGKKCSEEGCSSSAKNAGKCWKHGGSVKCLVDGCDRRGKSRGFCWAHGGGTKCSSSSCAKVAVSNGYCWAHGGGKRCAYEGCKKAAYERTHNYCVKHHEQLKDGNVTLEV